MSDKSFGDHTNRNLVKNPLLSSAVTGLSLEDLTHKAVLLPAAPSQTLITRSVPSGSQQATLGDADNATHQSGDTNYNIHPQTNLNPNVTDDLMKHEQKKLQMEFPTMESVSKASQKSPDDFDVNEYFARLQGTRYVSAPLHHPKDDNAKDLQATEENLEEINLNEPEKVETQQSLTADIAHNFSQLPNVLPHVANAVFSSFSNMLYKSREQTHDDAKVGYHEVKRDEGFDVPLMSVDEVAKDVAPPPKEPPVTGPGIYRITTKKKVYAQIPGLSSGEPQNLPFNTPPNQNISYFTPEHTKNELDNAFTSIEANNQFSNIDDRTINTAIDSDMRPNLQEIANFNEVIPPSHVSSQTILPPPPKFANVKADSQTQKVVLPPSVARRITGNHPSTTSHTPPTIPENLFIPAPVTDDWTHSFKELDISSSVAVSSMMPAMPNTVSTTSASETKLGINVPSNVPMFAASSSIAPSSTFFSEKNTLTFPIHGSVLVDHTQIISDELTSHIPTATNVIKTYDTGKINPLIKESPTGLIHFKETQQVLETSNIPYAIEKSSMAFVTTSQHEQSKPPPPITNKPYSMFTPQETPPTYSTESTVTASAILPPRSVLPPPMSSMPPSSMFAESSQMFSANVERTPFHPKPYAPRRKIGPSSSSLAPSFLPQNITIFNPSNPETNSDSNTEFLTSIQQSPDTAPNDAVFSQLEVKQDEPMPPITANSFDAVADITLFTPGLSQPLINVQQQIDSSVFTTSAHEDRSFNQALPNTADIGSSFSKAEVLKPPEPPKLATSNFRMIKKKPQYYSGPIEGVGSISNNIKPVIPPIETPSFSGNLYVPQQIIPNVSSSEHTANVQDYYSPTQNVQDSKSQISFATNRVIYDPNKENQMIQAQPNNQPFDITQNQAPFELSSPFDLSQPSTQAVDSSSEQETYNTAFDLSRATTEAYEAKHTKGYGLIGSLKSKLSSLDINKIQNTVTTFFDPAYNEPKKETIAPKVDEPYRQTEHNLQSNFEIFVPTTQQYDNQSYGQNYVQQDPYSYYQNQYTASSYFADSSAAQNHPSQLHQEEAVPLLSTSDVNRPQTITEITQSSRDTHFSITGPTAALGVNITTIPSLVLPDNLRVNQRVSEKQSNETNVAAFSFPKTQDSTPLIPTFPTSISDVDTTCRRTEDGSKVRSATSSKSQENIGVINEQIKDCPKMFHDEPPVIPSLEKSSVVLQNEDIQNISSKLTSTATNVHTYQEAEKVQQTLLSDPMSALSFFDLHPTTITTNIGISDQESLILSLVEPIINIGEETMKKETSKDISKLESTAICPEYLAEFKTTYTHTPDLITGLFSKFEENKIISDSTNVYTDSTIMKKKMDSSGDCDTVKHLDVTKISTDLPPAELFSKFKEKETNESQSKSLLESITKEGMPIVAVSSVPLFGLSTIIADTSKEITKVEGNVGIISLFDDQNVSLFDRNASVSFFENMDDKITQSKQSVMSSSSLFGGGLDMTENICNVKQAFKNFGDDPSRTETCDPYSDNWKINDHEKENEDDVTDQLIENITSRIQLQNSVEVPLTENKGTNAVQDDNDQFEEITQIAEETIETIQVQSATELLEDESKANYGWRTDKKTDMVEYNFITDGQSSFNFNDDSQTLTGHDYSFKIDPNALGFYGKNSLFFNKDDSINEGTKELPRQTSIPSAPPEEDTKSEGLDVHSIEQDAKEDFPIFEEYVIEPENDKSDIGNVQVRDTFTNRIERFKQMEESPDEFNTFVTPKSPVIMASYFDTGNYAVETHYKNISSPIMRIPPGFEDEYRKMSLGQESCIPRMPGVLIPETSTQTKVTVTNTYTMSNQGIGFTVESNISKILDDRSPINNLASFPTPSTNESEGAKESVTETKKDYISTIESTEESAGTSTKITADTSFDSQSQKPELEVHSVFNISQDLGTLPDPRSFFNVGVEDTFKKEEDSGFNRLASYFNTSPERPEHSKPFFELSQSQNHYRHESHGNNPTFAKNLNANIPDEIYLANLNLIKDLTSPQNLVVSETIVRTVNYFTVEYENDLKNEKLKTSKDNVSYNPNKTTKINTEHHKNTDENSNLFNTDNINTKIDDTDLNLKINNCEFCCNFVLHDLSDINNIKVRKAMNDTVRSEGGAPHMDSPKEATSKSVTVNFGTHFEDDSNDAVDVIDENRPISEYVPVQHHWFYRVDVEDKSIWRGFSTQDSKALEEAYLSPELNDQTLVATDGGRYDVNIIGRIRTPVYWSEKPTNVRRCSWFYKGTTDARYVPYTEAVAGRLEMEYRHGITTGEWHRRLVLPSNELVVMHGPSVMVHFLHTGSTDGFSAPPLFGKRVYRNPPKIKMSRDQCKEVDHLIMFVHGAGEHRSQKEKLSASRPRVVRRGHEESEIEDVEPSRVDHLLLLCHGVGSACDMRFRPVEEVVDDFRATSMQLIQSHYNNSYSSGVVNRVEVLPISWHSTLHSGETGVDRRLAQITLDSIPRLRNFTNDTVLDVLFYTSPVYCQTIIDTVCKELNRIYTVFKQRNPDFEGGVSLGGHSLGSVILYDLLCHQQPLDLKGSSSIKNFVAGSPGISQPYVKYPQLVFSPAAMYALGSPIAIFECIRGVESLSLNFALPTCKNFFNIFHPYDPIAYRIEPMINPQLKQVKPHLIPHHKGRKRMHLELKDTMVRVGADIKQKLMESLRTTWNKWKSSSPPTDGQLEKVVEEEMEKDQLCEDKGETENQTATPDMLGRLNGGRRIDYVLQEAPLEMINEYLFAMTSHVGYWESEDTMLLMLREIYDSMGVQPDSTVPQPGLTVQRTRVANDDDLMVDAADPSTSRGAS